MRSGRVRGPGHFRGVRRVDRAQGAFGMETKRARDGEKARQTQRQTGRQRRSETPRHIVL